MSKSDYRETLQTRELYLLEVETPGMYLLYAPLADCMLPVSEDDAMKLAAAMTSPENADQNVMDILDALCDVDPVCDRKGHVR